MYMRLAFAVAAHLEPEILVVDEVLAVGDAAFQKKCLGKMSEVAKGGRTVLFVSHQMAAVENLCGSAALMGEGRIQAVGPADRVIQTYLEHTSGGDSDWSALGERLDRQGDGSLQVVGFRLVDHGDQPVQSLRCGRGYQWELQVANRVGKAVSNVELALGVDDPAGARVAHLSMNLIGATPLDLPAEGGVISVRFPRWPLAPGRYGVTIFLTSGGRIVDWIRQAIFVDVDGGDYYGTGKLPPHGSGLLLIDHEMRLKEPVGHVA
jgi:lipopolysaccharide transport system ATP-binding protein